MHDVRTSSSKTMTDRGAQHAAPRYLPGHPARSDEIPALETASRNPLGKGGIIWLVLLIFAAATFPLLWVRFPPIMDYPNHLARIWLLSGGAASTPMSSFYIVDWSRSATNVGVDWIAAQLGHFLSLNALDRLLRLLMFIGPAAGTAWLGRAVHGRLSIWHVAPLGFAWGTTAIAGFMSFSIALGAAAAAATIIQYRQARLDPLTLILHFFCAASLLWLHPFGLLFYAALVTGIIIGPDWLSIREIFARRLKQIVTYAVISVTPIIVLYLFASRPPSTHIIEFNALSITTLVKLLLSPALSYNVLFDILLIAPIVLIPLVAWRFGTLRVHAGLFLIAFILGIACFAAPSSLGDASWLDRRLPPMVALIFCAAVLPDPATERWRTITAALLTIAILARVVWITNVWIQRDRDLADLLAVTQPVKPGDSIIVVQQQVANVKARPLGRNLVGATDGLNAIRRHLPAMLVPLRQAFIPTLFSVPGQQPIRVTPAKLIDTIPSSYIPSSEKLAIGSSKDTYLSRWRCDFKYVLLIGADEPASKPFAMTGLRPVATRGFASLYAVAPVKDAMQSCGPVGKRP